MIQTFADKRTAMIFEGFEVHKLPKSIQINDQWRVCFAWHDGNAFDVEIVDYH